MFLFHGMRIATKDLRLDHLVVLYPGTLRFSLAEKVEAVPLRAIAEGVWARIF